MDHINRQFNSFKSTIEEEFRLEYRERFLIISHIKSYISNNMSNGLVKPVNQAPSRPSNSSYRITPEPQYEKIVTVAHKT